MPMHNPPHPGEALREDMLPALRMTAGSLAQRLGCSITEISEVLDGKSSITAELAQRLELAGLGAARVYLAEQLAYDSWQSKTPDRS